MRALLLLTSLLAMKLVGYTHPKTGVAFTREGAGFVAKSSLHPFFRPGMIEGAAGEKLTNPYANSVWVRAAVRILSAPIASVPLVFASSAGGQAVTLPELTAFWTKPARGLHGAVTLGDLIEGTVGWLKLRGECYWLLGDEWLTRSARKGAMRLANPQRMRALLSRDGEEVLGWEYTHTRGRRELLLPEQVIRLAQWNPYDDASGLGDLDAASVAAEADFLAGKFGLNLMRNNGDRGPVISVKTQISDAQRIQIEQAIREKRAASARGEVRSLVMPADIDVKDPQAQALDAALVAQRLENRHEIAIAFGIPPSMFDVTQSYSIGSASDYFRLIETACAPLAARIADAIEQVTERLTGRTLVARFNFDEHSTMQAARRERIDAAQKLFSLGVPLAVINETLGLGLPRVDGDEQGYLPYSVVPIGQESVMYALEPVAEMPVETDPAAKLVRLLEARRTSRAVVIDVPPGTPALSWGARMLAAPSQCAACAGDIEEKAGDSARTSHWKRIARLMARHEKVARGKITKVLAWARGETLRKLAQLAPLEPKAIAQRAAVADFLFLLGEFTSKLTTELRGAATAALDASGTQALGEIGVNDPFTMPAPEALAYFRLRENKLKDTSDAIYERLKGNLTDGFEKGETLDELTARVKQTFKGIEDGAARTIAATETSSAFGVGRQRALEKAGIEWKQWLTSALPNVRATHAEADQQTVAIDKPFTVGAAQLMHPGDPTGPAEEVINCRCTSIAVRAPKEEQTT